MASFFQTSLVAALTFLFVGSAAECMFIEKIEKANRENPREATALIESVPKPAEPKPAMPLPKQGNLPQAKPLEPQPARGSFDCRAQSLSDKVVEVFNAEVTSITDGDTLTVSTGSEELKIRLWGIDAPEMNQPLGKAAKDKLTKLMPIGSHTNVYPIDRDVYGRTIAAVGPNNQWAHNVTIVAYGLAYHVDKFESSGNICLSEAQRMAKTWRDGVWEHSESGGVRPWVHLGKQMPSYGSTAGSN